jgi:hypothetical protein
VVILDKEKYGYLNSKVKFNFDNIRANIYASFKKTRSGYLVDIRIYPLALGFVLVPEVHTFQTMIDIFDVNFHQGNQYSILSTSNIHDSGILAALDLVVLSTPLKSNISKIPDILFKQIDYYPIYIPTDNENQCFEFNSKIILSRSPFWEDNYSEMVLELVDLVHTTVDEEHLKYQSLIIKEKIYFFIQNRVFKSEINKIGIDESNNHLLNQPFLFFDNSIGLITCWDENDVARRQITSGACGAATNFIFKIYRISENSELLNQINEEGCMGMVFIEKDNLQFSRALDGIEWVQTGKIIKFVFGRDNNEVEKPIELIYEFKLNSIGKMECELINNPKIPKD